jgi:hypothetical protein
MDMDGNSKEIDINKLNSVEDVASEFKKFRLDIKKGKLKNMEVYEPKAQEEN